MWIAFLGVLAGFLYVSKDTIAETVGSVVSNDDRFDSLFKKYGAKYSVPWTWLKAIAMNESSLGRHPSVARGLMNPNDIEASKSEDGKSWGLMQVTIKTARGLDPTATEAKLNNAEYSIGLAAQYLAQLSKQFSMVESRYVEWVIKSYNQGPGNSMKEKTGQISGYAQEYWERFQRNLKKAEGV